MTYAVMNVMYGIPLRGDVAQHFVDEVGVGNGWGVVEFYSGSADEPPRAFGIKLCGFDECTDVVKIKDLTLEPARSTMAEYQKMFNALGEREQDKLNKISPEPFVFILMSTS